MSNLRVLIIDDDKHLCSALKSLLEHIAPVEVVTCETFAGGLKIADPDKFDAILLDLRFRNEGIDGTDAIRIMRETLKTSGKGTVPIVAFSTENGAMQQRALFAGAFAFICKPFESPKRIFDILVGAAAEHRSRRSIEPVLKSLERQDKAIQEAKHDSTMIEPAKRAGHSTLPLLAVVGLLFLLAWNIRLERELAASRAALPVRVEGQPATQAVVGSHGQFDLRLAELRTRPTLANVTWLRGKAPTAESIEAMRVAADCDDPCISQAAQLALIKWGKSWATH